MKKSKETPKTLPELLVAIINDLPFLKPVVIVSVILVSLFFVWKSFPDQSKIEILSLVLPKHTDLNKTSTDSIVPLIPPIKDNNLSLNAIKPTQDSNSYRGSNLKSKTNNSYKSTLIKTHFSETSYVYQSHLESFDNDSLQIKLIPDNFSNETIRLECNYLNGEKGDQQPTMKKGIQYPLKKKGGYHVYVKDIDVKEGKSQIIVTKRP